MEHHMPLVLMLLLLLLASRVGGELMERRLRSDGDTRPYGRRPAYRAVWPSSSSIRSN